ncbi:hypothetical protein KCV87_07600 [Actinosynnema pretiosum subsp. pretiosum]|uniref:Uncharacterized protein n=1 Tax=Actinosynnema pretiosum subsp. pretiosum TaxID=103721 RepID=A0AA45R5G3_9PSEU|nr:hypothetical protein KCV87_07600 [Actinosynnema pretiosum subsp. pretiosum]
MGSGSGSGSGIGSNSSGAAGRVAALVVGVAIIVVLAVVVVGQNGGDSSARSGDDGAGCTADVVRVKGLIGSEKQSYFDDPDVRTRLRCLGFEVAVSPAGSREDMLVQLEQDPEHAFAFPSSTATAEKIKSETGAKTGIALFSSPMVVVTHRPLVEVLTRAGIVRQDGGSGGGGEQLVDVEALLGAARDGLKWNQLPGNPSGPNKVVSLSTTDPKDSNSAIMMLSIASHAANGGAVVTSDAEIARVMPDLCSMVLQQGQQSPTSEVLFNDYLRDPQGGRIQLGLVYEAQFRSTKPAPALPEDAVALFPNPTVYSRHTFIPLEGEDDARRLGEALGGDDRLIELAAAHGFRPERASAQPSGAPEAPRFVVEAPSAGVLERMLDGLAEIQRSGRGCGR